MKYDAELIISASDIAKEATLLLALATQSDDIYDKIESATKKFIPPIKSKNIHDPEGFYGLEQVHWDITMQTIITKMIYIAVVVRNLNYHLMKNSEFSSSTDKNDASQKKLIDFCSKVIHLTEASLGDKDFIIEIDTAQKSFKYNIYEFCSDVVSFASFAESYLFENR